MEKTIKQQRRATPVHYWMPLAKKRIQKNIGSFLSQAHAVNPTILMALSAIVEQESSPNEETFAHVKQFFRYMWMHPDTKFRYTASNMILNVHSDTSYLSAPKA